MLFLSFIGIPILALIYFIHLIYYKFKKLLVSNKKIIFYLVTKDLIKTKKNKGDNLHSPKNKSIFIKLRVKNIHLDSEYVNGILIMGIFNQTTSLRDHNLKYWMLGNGKSILEKEIYLLPSGTKLYPKLTETPTDSVLF